MMRQIKNWVGIFVKTPLTEVIDMARAAGMDVVVVDLEHSPLSEEQAIRLVRHARVTGIAALVRVAEIDRGQVNRLLEAGASGIQLSTVRSAAQIRELRAAARYAPEGSRSVSLAHPEAGYGATPLPDYLAAQAANPPIVVAQIETATTIDPLDEIVAAGPDVLFIGSTDLAVDVGMDQDRLATRSEEIVAAAEAGGVPLGVFGRDPRATYELVGSDLSLLRQAVTQVMAPPAA